MKLTSDEAQILAECVNISKYEMLNNSPDKDKFFKALEILQNRLEMYKDQRRTGRKSQNSWSDLEKRFIQRTINAK